MYDHYEDPATVFPYPYILIAVSRRDVPSGEPFRDYVASTKNETWARLKDIIQIMHDEKLIYAGYLLADPSMPFIDWGRNAFADSVVTERLHDARDRIRSQVSVAVTPDAAIIYGQGPRSAIRLLGDPVIGTVGSSHKEWTLR